jgi:hypothetical protein
MKKWVLKAIIQKIITFLPFSFKINYLFQKHITKNVVLSDDFFDIMLNHFKELIEYGLKNKVEFKNIRVIELGTGWHPILPFLLYTIGVREIITIDLRCHIRKENLGILIEKLIKNYELGKLNIKEDLIEEKRINVLKEILNNFNFLSVNEILQMCNTTQSIQNANKLNFLDNSFDLCYSINVLEHVDENSIFGISEEFYRISKKSGYHYHAIGTYDHFVHIDKSISKFNYLKYSAREWKWIDNGIQPQNRKRISYFRETFISLRYAILNEIMWENEPSELAKIEIHPDFIHCKDIDIPYGTFILRK